MTAPGHGICRHCGADSLLLSDGTTERHYGSSRFNPCPGSFRAPAVEVLSKDTSPCCLSRRDGHGRMPIGYCSTTCIRRPK